MHKVFCTNKSSTVAGVHSRAIIRHPHLITFYHARTKQPFSLAEVWVISFVLWQQSCSEDLFLKKFHSLYVSLKILMIIITILIILVNVVGGIVFIAFSGYTFYLAITGIND